MTVSNHTILLVDDDSGMLESNKALLDTTGYQIVTALGGREAIRKLQSEEFDVVLACEPPSEVAARGWPTCGDRRTVRPVR